MNASFGAQEWDIMKHTRKHIGTCDWCLPLIWTSYFFLGLYAMLIFSVYSHRHRRISTLTLGSVILFTYWAIIFSMIDTKWIEGHASLTSSYSLYSPDTFANAKVTLNIGLSSINITYVAKSTQTKGTVNANRMAKSMIYNEKFDLNMGYVPYQYDDPSKSMKIVALKRGLPNAILTITELFSRNEGYAYGRHLQYNGDFVLLGLICSITLCALGNILLISVPHHGYLVFIVVGSLQLLTNTFYAIACPPFYKNQIRIEGVPMEFNFGRSYYIILVSGIVNVLTGLSISLIIYVGWSDSISTMFEIDYESPWYFKEIENCMREGRIGRLKRTEETLGLTNSTRKIAYPGMLGKSAGEITKPLRSLNPAINKTETNNQVLQRNEKLRTSMAQCGILSASSLAHYSDVNESRLSEIACNVNLMPSRLNTQPMISRRNSSPELNLDQFLSTETVDRPSYTAKHEQLNGKISHTLPQPRIYQKERNIEYLANSRNPEENVVNNSKWQENTGNNPRKTLHCASVPILSINLANKEALI